MLMFQWQSNKVSLNLPASTTGQQLLDAVAKWCHYELGSFELILQRMPDGQFVSLSLQMGHYVSFDSIKGIECFVEDYNK